MLRASLGAEDTECDYSVLYVHHCVSDCQELPIYNAYIDWPGAEVT